LKNTDGAKYNTFKHGSVEMGALGGWEILVIFLIVLLIFGPKKLPEMGSAIGKAIREFKNAGKEIQQDITQAVETVENTESETTTKTSS
jgi:sec-independent protein translocase protein TatA